MGTHIDLLMISNTETLYLYCKLLWVKASSKRMHVSDSIKYIMEEMMAHNVPS